MQNDGNFSLCSKYKEYFSIRLWRRENSLIFIFDFCIFSYHDALVTPGNSPL